MRNIHINTTMLRVLEAVAAEKNLTRAAQHLNLTQSGVSHALRAWKDALGAPVVTRQGRSTILTAIGEEVLPEVRTALRSLQAISALSSQPSITGKLRVASVASVAISILPRVMKKMQALHPQTSVELLEGTDDEVMEWYDNGIADAAIGMLALSKRTDVLLEVELVAVLPPHDPLASYEVIGINDLDDKPFVMSTSGCETAILEHFGSAKRKLNIASRIRDTRAILAAIESGHGITILPTLSLNAAPPRLVVRPLDPPLLRNIYVVANSAAPLCAEFIRLVKLT